MSYRIEIAKTGRAGCQDTLCKKTGDKIQKGELRFGVWVDLPGAENGSYRWRHWGCVSGKTVGNLQEKISDGDGDYQWDMIDGYDELDESPEIQEKIRRVVTQGHIDPEDFKGDPEFNKPGHPAIRGRTNSKKKAKDDEVSLSAVSRFCFYSQLLRMRKKMPPRRLLPRNLRSVAARRQMRKTMKRMVPRLLRRRPPKLAASPRR
ncbi:zf-PARP-domain-containing protein [Daldinia loculata]|nr:zf-PARP-domain-containing protein [Daldinia loculata]